MSDSELLHKIQEKMAKERRVMQGAQAMRQSSNPQVQASLDAQINEARINLRYLEEQLGKLQMRQGMSNMSVHDHRGSADHGMSSQRNNQFMPQNGRAGYEYGEPQGGYSTQMGAGTGAMPSRPPYGPTAPGMVPKARPNYSKLGKNFKLGSSR
jgi:hypothetical protein